MTQLRIDEIIERGQVFDLRRSIPMSDLRVTVRALFADLRGAAVDYVLVGGVALLIYVAGRNTHDIDVIVDPAYVQRLPWNAVVQDRDFGQAVYRGLSVDLRLTTNPLFAYVSQHERAEVTFDDMPITCATREGLLLLKLYALPSLYRQGNLARAAIYETDILLLMQGRAVNERALLDILGQHLAAHDVDELQQILQDQKNRRRFD